MQNQYLTKEQELSLGQVIFSYRQQDGGTTEEEARQAHLELFEANIKGAYNIVHKLFKACQVNLYERADALQDAAMELSRFIWEKYDYRHQTKVLTGATSFIRKKLLTSGREHRAIPFTTYQYGQYIGIHHAATEYENNLINEEELLDFVVRKTNVKREDALVYLDIRRGITSLDFEVRLSSAAQGSLHETIVDQATEERVRQQEIQKQVRELLHTLPTLEKSIVEHYFQIEGDDRPKSVFCRELGIRSSDYAKRLEKALTQLKKVVHDE